MLPVETRAQKYLDNKGTYFVKNIYDRTGEIIYTHKIMSQCFDFIIFRRYVTSRH